MKIIDFERKGNLVRFYLGADELERNIGITMTSMFMLAPPMLSASTSATSWKQLHFNTRNKIRVFFYIDKSRNLWYTESRNFF